ncbi:MAG: electron transfer flavoprotein subunit alpha/FixB family protein, partial [Jatrophihabitans sp.]
MIIVLVESDATGPLGTSLEALTFARDLGERSQRSVQAIALGEVPSSLLGALGEQGVSIVHHPDDERVTSYAAAAWAACVVDVIESNSAEVVVGSGTPRGNEVLAHVAARLDVAMAANVVLVDDPASMVVTRQVVGGA